MCSYLHVHIKCQIVNHSLYDSSDSTTLSLLNLNKHAQFVRLLGVVEWCGQGLVHDRNMQFVTLMALVESRNIQYMTLCV